MVIGPDAEGALASRIEENMLSTLARMRARLAKIPALRLLRSTIRRVTHPAPLGLRSFGRDSMIRRPRKVDGNRFISIGHRTLIAKYSWINAIPQYAGETFRPELIIGDDVYVGQYSCIVCMHRVTIEDGCVLSEQVYISDSAHGMDPEMGLIMKQKLLCKGEVRIGRSTFLGFRSCVLPGVMLGEHCIVGANSVVTRSFPAYSMVVGSPARLVKTYCPVQRQWVPVEVKVAEHKA
jgi:acetyltransferase-like isoleucine patch superfamily enzyme